MTNDSSGLLVFIQRALIRKRDGAEPNFLINQERLLLIATTVEHRRGRLGEVIMWWHHVAAAVLLNAVTAGDPSRPPILVVHGIGQRQLSFKNQLQAPLTDEFFIVSFDLRGHGNSGKPWSENDYRDSQNWAGDVARIMRALKLDRPVLLG